jgi:hypothetical protein
MVPEYVPATDDAGMVNVSVGFQLAELLPTPAAQEAAVPGDDKLATMPRPNVPMPLVAVAAPDEYAMLALTTVSFTLADPVVKSVDDAVAVHVAIAAPRPSVTVTVPS